MFISNKKDSLIQLRVSKIQKEKIRDIAASKNMTITEYIFSLLESDYLKEETKK